MRRGAEPDGAAGVSSGASPAPISWLSPVDLLPHHCARERRVFGDRDPDRSAPSRNRARFLGGRRDREPALCYPYRRLRNPQRGRGTGGGLYCTRYCLWAYTGDGICPLALKRARDLAIGLPALGVWQATEGGRLWRRLTPKSVAFPVVKSLCAGREDHG